MEAEISLKKDWEITPEAFEKLLEWLSHDREAAGREYENIRRKLIKLFKWRNCTPEEEYADMTITRVMRRIVEGAEVNVEKPYLYFHGTALNVIREYWRKQQKFKQEDFETLDQTKIASESPEQELEQEFEREKSASRFDCMKKCLNELSPEKRDFIIKYHHGEKKKDVRKAMAEKLHITMNVLRIRACRVREGLQNCLQTCVKNSL